MNFQSLYIGNNLGCRAIPSITSWKTLVGEHLDEFRGIKFKVQGEKPLAIDLQFTK